MGEGDGAGERSLVLLHGWGSSQRIWKLVDREALVSRYRLIPLDLPGTGKTEAIPNGSTRDLADWVAGEMQRRGVKRYAVLGHSMGANVAVHLAAGHPESVPALVLVGAALQSDRLKAANIYLHKRYGAAILSVARLAAGLGGRLEALLPERNDPGWTRGYMRRSGYLMSDNTVHALQSQLRGLLSAPADIHSLRPDLPILLLHGGRDSTIPLDWAEAAGLRGHHTALTVYADALHCPMDTHTVQFCQDVRAFLDLVDWT